MCGFVVRYDQRSHHSTAEFRIALPVGLSGTLESVPEVVVQVGLSEVLLAISVELRATLPYSIPCEMHQSQTFVHLIKPLLPQMRE